MPIILNGKATEIPDSVDTVAALLEHLGLAGYPALVELNGVALLKKEFSESRISAGDQVEIIKMVAGG
jgi:sulfur carrier protein